MILNIDWTYLLPTVLIFGCWSMLVKDNPLFKLCQYTAIAVAPGYLFLTTVNTVWQKSFTPAFKGDALSILAIGLGVLIMFKLVKKLSWLSRFPYAIGTGLALGVSTRGYLKEQLSAQIVTATSTLWGATPWDTFNNIVIMVMTIGTIAYFVFTRKQGGALNNLLNPLGRVGRIALMITWGATYAAFTTTRINYMTDALQIVFYKFLGIMA